MTASPSDTRCSGSTLPPLLTVSQTGPNCSHNAYYDYLLSVNQKATLFCTQIACSLSGVLAC